VVLVVETDCGGEVVGWRCDCDECTQA